MDILKTLNTIKKYKINEDYFIQKKEESKLMKLIAFLLKPICPDFMESYVTVIGRTIYAPNGKIRKITLMHELVHIHDYKNNPIWFVFSYLFLLPAIFTMRAYWERRGYAITIYLSTVKKETLKERLWHEFSSSSYLYMWPFRNKFNTWFEEIYKMKK